MAASSYLSKYADKLLKGENQSTQVSLSFQQATDSNLGVDDI